MYLKHRLRDSQKFFAHIKSEVTLVRFDFLLFPSLLCVDDKKDVFAGRYHDFYHVWHEFYTPNSSGFKFWHQTINNWSIILSWSYRWPHETNYYHRKQWFDDIKTLFCEYIWSIGSTCCSYQRYLRAHGWVCMGITRVCHGRKSHTMSRILFPHEIMADQSHRIQGHQHQVRISTSINLSMTFFMDVIRTFFIQLSWPASTTTSYPTTSSACCKVPVKCLPQDCPTGQWQVYEGKWMPQPAITISIVP